MVRKYWSCLLLMALTMVFRAQGASDNSEGRDLYQEYCSSCHGIRLIVNGKLLAEPIQGTPEVLNEGQGGLNE